MHPLRKHGRLRQSLKPFHTMLLHKTIIIITTTITTTKPSSSTFPSNPLAGRPSHGRPPCQHTTSRRMTVGNSHSTYSVTLLPMLQHGISVMQDTTAEVGRLACPRPQIGAWRLHCGMNVATDAGGVLGIAATWPQPTHDFTAAYLTLFYDTRMSAFRDHALFL